MTPGNTRDLAQSVASMLISHAAHGHSTSSLAGVGEISLRDALVVASASVGARLKQAWIIRREVTPSGWTNADVDVVISRKPRQQEKLVTGVELKWWRRADTGNGANRRRGLVRDVMRSAALYPQLEGPAFVALLATAKSWAVTSGTRGNDAPPMILLKTAGIQTWRLKDLATAPAIKYAATNMNGNVPVANIFRTELLASARLQDANATVATARVWRVWKQQNTKFLDDSAIQGLFT